MFNCQYSRTLGRVPCLFHGRGMWMVNVDVGYVHSTETHGEGAGGE